MLVSAGADVHHKDDRGRSVLHLAARSKNIEMIDYVLSLGLDINEEDNKGFPPLFTVAAFNSNIAVLEKFIAAGADIRHKTKDGFCILHATAQNPHIDIVEYILSFGLDINAEDEESNIPLFFAAEYNSNADVLKKLVDSGAAVHHKSHTGLGLIHAAAHNEHIEIIEYVTSLGLDINEEADDGMTPLCDAVSENKNVNVVKSLVSAGADVTHKYEGNNIITMAIANEMSNKTTDMLDYILTLGLDINAEDRFGHTPLFFAASSSENANVLRKLICKGADIHHRDYSGRGLLHLAAWNEHIEILEYVLTLGLDVNAEDINGHTPLFDAVHFACNVDGLKTLIAAGADIHHKSHTGLSILHQAAKNGNTEIIDYVLTLGLS